MRKAPPGVTNVFVVYFGEHYEFDHSKMRIIKGDQLYLFNTLKPDAVDLIIATN